MCVMRYLMETRSSKGEQLISEQILGFAAPSAFALRLEHFFAPDIKINS